MRTIKFRGLRTDGKGWVYGNLINWHPTLNPRIIWYTEQGEHDKELDFKETNFEVTPESVGQFTGLHDKNGNEIYEDDLIRSSINAVYQIVFEDGSFRMKPTAKHSNWPSFPITKEGMKRSVLIDNIHENPELCK